MPNILAETLALIACTSLVLGCSAKEETNISIRPHGPEIPIVWNETLLLREIKLSLTNSFDKLTGIRLLSVSEDGTAKIRIASGKIMVGKPGEFFPCFQFGSTNLQLVSSFAISGKAVFRYRTSDVK
jgi:hypothetical protein